MTSQPPCPDAGRWRSLLDGSATILQQAELSAHLETCPRCQQTLEGLAAERAAGERTPELAGAGREPALRAVMDRLKDEVAFAPTRPAAPPEEDDPLAFLTPTDRPGLVGLLGRYEVLELVGRGGMGVVLKAFDPSLHRVVAIKVLAPCLAASPSARKRFQREARAAGCLCHDYVMPIHSVEEINNQLCLVMHFAAGISLQEKIDRSAPLGTLEIVRIGFQIAAGLAAAHAQGLIHRDVKPANILLENGLERVRITDFGLARAADQASLTSTGVVAGTPQYMSPEQARGEPFDHRSDLFSLGSVLYALCTGRLPFRGSTTMGILRKLCEEEPPRIRSLNPDIPDWLEAIVTKLQAKDPAAPFQTAAETADLLGRWLAHLQQPATVPPPASLAPPVRPPESPRSRRQRALVAAGLLVVACLLTVSEAVSFTRLVETAATVLRIRTPEGTLVVEVEDPGVKISVDGSVLVITGAGVQEIRLKPGTHKVTATKDGKPVRSEIVEITRGGKSVVRVSREEEGRAATDEGKRHIDAAEEALRRAERALYKDRVQEALLRELAARREAEAERDRAEALRRRFQDLPDGHQQPRQFVGHTGAVWGLAFSPDARWLVSAAGKGDRSIRVWDVKTGKEIRQLTDPTHDVTSLAVSPDAKLLLTGSTNGMLRLWDLATGKEVQQIKGHTDQVSAVGWLPDGKFFLSGSYDNTVRMWEAESGKEVRVFKGHTGLINSLAVSPDGRRFVTAAADQSVCCWDVASGKLLWKLRNEVWRPVCVAFAPDASRVVCAGRDLNLVDAATGKILVQVGGEDAEVSCVAFAPDGKRLATGSWGGAVRLWDPQIGKVVRGVEDSKEAIRAVAFAPDGRWLAVGGGGPGPRGKPRDGAHHIIRLYPLTAPASTP